MIIVGAGMAGLLAAHMLRRYGVTVWEAQPQLPDNHGALLRFRSDAVAEATGIPLRRVTVHKAVLWAGRLWQQMCPLAAHNAYSVKVTGAAMARSILDLRPGDRYIAPPTFLDDLSRDLNILYNTRLANLEVDQGRPWVSTIPMPAVAAMAARDDTPDFPHLPVWSVRCRVPLTDLYQTMYYPGADTDYYRASFTGDLLTIEYTKAPTDPLYAVGRVLHDFGLTPLFQLVSPDGVTVKRQEYGKLLPVNDQWRRAFIVYLTTRYNMYSVGRFATWRQILLDDVVTDVRQVARMIEDRTPYLRMLRKANDRY